MIQELLTMNTVNVEVEVEDWQDAVRKSGELLVNAGYVENCYVEAMIDVVKELGPYIVLLKGVALAHARPEMGSKKIGLSLITLKNPVNFGNENNDPVKLVFALSAVDSESHMELIGELGEIFYDESELYSLAECHSKEELIDRVLEICSNAKN